MNKLGFFVIDKIVILVLVIGVFVVLAGTYSDFSGIRFDGSCFPEIIMSKGQQISGTTAKQITLSDSTVLSVPTRVKVDSITINDSINAGLFPDFGIVNNKLCPTLEDPTLAYGIQISGLNLVCDTVGVTTNLYIPWEIKIDSFNYMPGEIPVDSLGGIIPLSVGGVDNDSIVLRHKIEFVKAETTGTQELFFECYISFPDTSDLEFRIGLAERNLSMSGNGVSGIFFQKVDNTPIGGHKVILETNRAGSIDSVTALADFDLSTWYRFAFWQRKGTVIGQVNGVQLTTISKFVPRTVNLTPIILIKSGATRAARIVTHVRHLKIVQTL